MKLEIITPEKKLFSGDVTSVMLPGTNGLFTVWNNHAPIISSLIRGKLSFMVDNAETVYTIEGGFVEINKNVVTVCVELS